jgi:hypothetical protein
MGPRQGADISRRSGHLTQGLPPSGVADPPASTAGDNHAGNLTQIEVASLHSTPFGERRYTAYRDHRSAC